MSGCPACFTSRRATELSTPPDNNTAIFMSRPCKQTSVLEDAASVKGSGAAVSAGSSAGIRARSASGGPDADFTRRRGRLRYFSDLAALNRFAIPSALYLARNLWLHFCL